MVASKLHDIFIEQLSKKIFMTTEEYDKLPENVKDTLNTFDENGDSYQECERLISELNLIGYTAEYYLDGVLYDVRPL